MNALGRFLLALCVLALISLPVVAVLQGWVGAERFALTRLRVSGVPQHVADAQLQAALQPYARKGFFAVPLDDARRAIEALPWVDSAEVSKKWPDVLEVAVTEHRPIALWDDSLLLSASGRLYPRAAMGDALPEGLPQLGGDARRRQDVVRFYNSWRNLFAGSGREVREVRLDARGSWMLRFADGTEILVGRHAPHARVERFAQLLPQLIPPPGKTLQRADLRYANGFALQWRDAPEPAAGAIPAPGAAALALSGVLS